MLSPPRSLKNKKKQKPSKISDQNLSAQGYSFDILLQCHFLALRVI